MEGFTVFQRKEPVEHAQIVDLGGRKFKVGVRLRAEREDGHTHEDDRHPGVDLPEIDKRQ